MTALADLSTGIHRKLWDIQRTISPVEGEPADGDEAYSFAPAPAVFEEIRRQLKLKQLMVVPSVVGSSEHGRTQRVRIGIEVTDLEDLSQATFTWEGESANGLASACTVGLKGWYQATFLIPLAEPSAEKLHERRQQRKKDNPTATPAQIKSMLEPALAESKYADDPVAFKHYLSGTHGAESLEKLPREKVNAVVTHLRSWKGRDVPAPREQQPAPVAAGAETEPRDG